MNFDMTNTENYQDLETLSKAGHQPNGNRFIIRVDDKKVKVDDPVVTGRQVLNLVSKRPIEEHLLYFISRDGILEDIGLEEKIDLRTRGIERFITFENDRSFRFELDSQRQDWGAPKINEATLKKLAKVPNNYRVWIERRNTEDELLEVDDFIDLSQQGVERLYTGSVSTTAGDVSLPSADQRYLSEHNISPETISVNGQHGVIIPNYYLGEAVTPQTADILIMLPQGYPDVSPDMFYSLPWVSLKTGGWPNQADQAHQFNGQKWQRWSRHNKEWRPGKDGIWTMLRRIDTALQELICAA